VRALMISLLLVSRAGADVELGVRPEARLGDGYDDNLFLDPQTQMNGSTAPSADGIVDLEPRLYGWLAARGHQLTLNLDYLERVTFSHRDLRDLSLLLGWRSPSLGPISLLVGGRYEHWETDFYNTDDFDLGGVEAAVQAQLGTRVGVEARYRFGARNYSERPQLDLDHRVRGSLGVRATRWLQIEAAYTFWHISSDQPSADLERHRGELSLGFQPLSWLGFAAAYSLAYQHVPMALAIGMSGMTMPRDDVLHTLDLVISAQPLRWLELFARYSLLYSTSSDDSGRYHRNQVVTGVAVSWDAARTWRAPLPLEPRARGGAVTFRHHARPGQSVAVRGDWNGWSPQPMSEGANGMYEATYNLPPGRHEYSFVVDGQEVEPPDAAAYVPDGFGGRSAVLYVE
jgi:hypothetical protein